MHAPICHQFFCVWSSLNGSKNFYQGVEIGYLGLLFLHSKLINLGGFFMRSFFKTPWVANKVQVTLNFSGLGLVE